MFATGIGEDAASGPSSTVGEDSTGCDVAEAKEGKEFVDPALMILEESTDEWWRFISFLSAFTVFPTGFSHREVWSVWADTIGFCKKKHAWKNKCDQGKIKERINVIKNFWA